MYEQIEEYFNENNLPKYRFKQFKQAVFKRLVSSYDEIIVLPKGLREKLKAEFELTSLKQEKVLEGIDSVKFVLRTEDGNYIETVLMKHLDNRMSVCVSSQVFCAMGCKFCATGANKFKRNLNLQEIVEQVLFVNRYLKKQDGRVSNVVFMGMGEPFMNYDNVIESIKILNDEEYFGIGARHITVSTCGIVPKIKEFAEFGLQCRLAISFHAPNDELRSELMPINRRYGIDELMRAVDYFIEKTNKRVSFEYVLINGINDSVKEAKELVGLIKGKLIHVNLLVYNPHEYSEFEKPSRKKVHEFEKILKDSGIEVSIRVSLGQDIEGACGQLAGKKNKNL